MSFSQFFEEIFGFLFNPSSAIKSRLEKESKKPSMVKPLLYILYICIIIAVGMWFLIAYPDTLYYGVSGSDLLEINPGVLIDNPFVFLIGLIGLGLILIFLWSFLLNGNVNFALMKRLTKNRNPLHSKKDYLSLYSYSFTPFMLTIPIFFFRVFFFEKLLFFKPFFPLVDWTIPNIVFFCLIGVLFAWKFTIEFRINQKMFQVPGIKAMVTILYQVAILIVILTVPFAFNEMIFDLVKEGLA
ncbi:MAG: hypothetical protein ACFFCS_07745 [Candidatus Hodarchaeota archaeon]